jgi:predicted nucleic acid-binding protein
VVTILLDSSVIFDHLNGRRGRTKYLASLLDAGNSLACCAVNITEVYAGLRSEEEVATHFFMESLDFLEITPRIARTAGLLRRDWLRKGQTLSYTDVTLAAVAIEMGLPLMTDNFKHFPMPEIHLFPLAK